MLAQTTEQLAELLDETSLDAEAGSRDLRTYVELAWGEVESAPYIPNWHIDLICEHLQAVTEGQIEELLINVPPGCSKSLLTCVFWPTWEWGRDQAVRWFFASYDQHLSTRDSVKSRNLIRSKWYRQRWPDLAIRADQDEKTYYETVDGGYRLSTSVGGHGTGEHPDRIVVDDPHSAKKALSEAERLNVVNWWDQTMSTRGMSRGARRVVIMQRLHQGDLSGHMLAQGNPALVHLCLPMRYEPKRMMTTPLGWNDPRKKAGELLAPVQFPEKSVALLEVKLGSYGAAGQLQQRPAPAEGGIFKKRFWRYYDAPPLMDEIAISWDMTFKATGPSYVVGQVWGRHNAHYYLLEQDRGKWDFVDTCKHVEAMAARWPMAHAKYVEDKANGSAVLSALGTKISGLIGVEPEGGKEARAYAISPMVESGNVWLPEDDGRFLGEGTAEDFVQECVDFPNGSNDDQVDCMSQALTQMSLRQPVMLEGIDPSAQTKTREEKALARPFSAESMSFSEDDDGSPVKDDLSFRGKRRHRL